MPPKRKQPHIPKQRKTPTAPGTRKKESREAQSRTRSMDQQADALLSTLAQSHNLNSAAPAAPVDEQALLAEARRKLDMAGYQTAPLQMHARALPPPPTVPTAASTLTPHATIHPASQQHPRSTHLSPNLNTSAHNTMPIDTSSTANFVPQTVLREKADVMPTELNQYVAATSNMYERQALCACETPCSGEADRKWCYLNRDNAALLQAKFPGQGCPVYDTRQNTFTKMEQRVQKTDDGEPVRHCDASEFRVNKYSNATVIEEDAARARTRADDMLTYMKAEERPLTATLMLEYGISIHDAHAMSASPYLDLEQKLLTAGLMNYLQRFVESMQTTVRGALQDDAIMAMWKARVQRFLSLGPAQKKLETAPLSKPAPASVPRPPPASAGMATASQPSPFRPPPASAGMATTSQPPPLRPPPTSAPSTLQTPVFHKPPTTTMHNPLHIKVPRKKGKKKLPKKVDSYSEIDRIFKEQVAQLENKTGIVFSSSSSSSSDDSGSDSG